MSSRVILIMSLPDKIGVGSLSLAHITPGPHVSPLLPRVILVVLSLGPGRRSRLLKTVVSFLIFEFVIVHRSRIVIHTIPRDEDISMMIWLLAVHHRQWREGGELVVDVLKVF